MLLASAAPRNIMAQQAAEQARCAASSTDSSK
jgi:hypothetical protein